MSRFCLAIESVKSINNDILQILTSRQVQNGNCFNIRENPSKFQLIKKKISVDYFTTCFFLR